MHALFLSVILSYVRLVKVHVEYLSLFKKGEAVLDYLMGDILKLESSQYTN